MGRKKPGQRICPCQTPSLSRTVLSEVSLEQPDKADWDRAYRIALRVLRSPSLAEDAAQDVLLRLHERGDRYEVRDYDAWFRRVAYTQALRYVTSAWARRQSLRELDTDDLPSERPSPDQAASAALLSECLKGCMDALEQDDRFVFTERYLRGKSDREVAEALAIKTNAAKQRAFRARKRVRECVVHAGCAEDPSKPKTEPGLSHEACVPCDLGGPALKGGELLALKGLLGPSWSLENQHHLQKSFAFTTYSDVREFTQRVGFLAEAEGHHPEIAMSRDSVVVRTYTRKADGLTKSDFVLAAKIDHMLALMESQ